MSAFRRSKQSPQLAHLTDNVDSEGSSDWDVWDVKNCLKVGKQNGKVWGSCLLFDGTQWMWSWRRRTGGGTGLGQKSCSWTHTDMTSIMALLMTNTKLFLLSCFYVLCVSKNYIDTEAILLWNTILKRIISNTFISSHFHQKPITEGGPDHYLFLEPEVIKDLIFCLKPKRKLYKKKQSPLVNRGRRYDTHIDHLFSYNKWKNISFWDNMCETWSEISQEKNRCHMILLWVEYKQKLFPNLTLSCRE